MNILESTLPPISEDLSGAIPRCEITGAKATMALSISHVFGLLSTFWRHFLYLINLLPCECHLSLVETQTHSLCASKLRSKPVICAPPVRCPMQECFRGEQGDERGAQQSPFWGECAGAAESHHLQESQFLGLGPVHSVIWRLCLAVAQWALTWSLALLSLVSGPPAENSSSSLISLINFLSAWTGLRTHLAHQYF